jgi:hypothetical protein
VLVVGPGLRGQPDQRAARRRSSLSEGALLRAFNIQDSGGTAQDGGARRRADRARCCRRANRVRARARAVPAHLTRRPAVRRLGRLLGHHRQPGAGRGGRPARARTAAPRSCRRRPEIYGAEHLLTRARRVARGRREARRRASDGGRTTPRATTAR